MIVIADSSPIHYLVLIQVVEVLPRLFQRVLIPTEACSELGHLSAPAEVQRWIAAPPPWLEILSLAAASSAAIPDLDAGEEAAIRLAEQLSGSAFLLMDDAKARAAASSEESRALELSASCKPHPRVVSSAARCGTTAA